MVILDGAHNPSKIKSTISNLANLKFDALHLVIGMAEDKDRVGILKQIIPLAHRVFVTRFQNPERKCAHPKDLFFKAKRYLKKGAKIQMYLEPEQALDEAMKRARPRDLVLVTGSFFLAGELRRRWYSEEWVLTRRTSF